MSDTRSGALQRTRALIGLRRYEEAAAAARAGLAGDPHDPQLALLYASALCEARAKEALAAARHAVALQPDSPAAHRVLGWAAYRAGHFAQASDVLAHAIELDPQESESHVMRAEARLRMTGRARYQRRMNGRLAAEAHAHAAEAVRLRPAAPGGYLVHAKACLAERDPAGARQWAEHALSVQPDHPLGHQLLGLAAQQRGDMRSAADHFVDAGKLDPRSDTSIKLLRGLRRSLPVGVVGLLLVFRALGAAEIALGDTVGFILLMTAVLGFVGYQRYGARWHARRKMSERARQVLDRDRSMGKRRTR